MNFAIKAPPTRGSIVVLTNDLEPGGTSRGVQPCLSATDLPSFAGEFTLSDARSSRLVQEAHDWAICRSHRIRLEEQLTLQQEFRLLADEQSEALRTRLSLIETQVGEACIEQLLDELSHVQRGLFADDEEFDWS